MTVERRAGESPGARSRCHQPHMTAPERQAPWPGHPRQSTADQHTRSSRAWPLACLRSPTARKGTTRGVPPLPTDPIPPGTVRHPGGCLQPVLLRDRHPVTYRAVVAGRGVDVEVRLDRADGRSEEHTSEL